MTKTETTTESIQLYFYDDLRPKGLSDEALAKSEAIGNQSPTHLSAKKYDSLKSYFYDGDGLRVSRTDNMPGGITTYYVWDTENPTGYPQVIEEIENNQVVRRYGYGHFLENVDIWNGSAFERFYVVRDGTNSVRMLLDSTGNVAANYDYDAFGNILSVTNANPLTASNPFGFHSEYRDTATGLIYLRARWYQPRDGRFVGMDKYEGDNFSPSSIHKYSFVSNNPVNLLDPSGNDYGYYFQTSIANISQGFLSSVAIPVFIQVGNYFHFDREEDAAYAVFNMTNIIDISRRYDYEYGGIILETKQNKFFFELPKPLGKRRGDFTSIFDLRIFNKDVYSVKFPNSKVVATYHTHGHVEAWDYGILDPQRTLFSDKDLNAIKNINLNSYLGVYSGKDGDSYSIWRLKPGENKPEHPIFEF